MNSSTPGTPRRLAPSLLAGADRFRPARRLGRARLGASHGQPGTGLVASPRWHPACDQCPSIPDLCLPSRVAASTEVTPAGLGFPAPRSGAFNCCFATATRRLPAPQFTRAERQKVGHWTAKMDKIEQRVT